MYGFDIGVESNCRINAQRVRLMENTAGVEVKHDDEEADNGNNHPILDGWYVSKLNIFHVGTSKNTGRH